MRPLSQNLGDTSPSPCGYTYDILAAVRGGELVDYNLGHNLYQLPQRLKNLPSNFQTFRVGVHINYT